MVAVEAADGEARVFGNGKYGQPVFGIALEELVRVTRPGGHIVFMLRTDLYRNDGFRGKQDDLEFSEMWQPVSVTDQFQALPIGEPELYYQVWTYMIK